MRENSNHPGRTLKRLRERRCLTLREVEAHSRRLARKKGNLDYFISSGCLNSVENGCHRPGLFKIYTLGAIYGTHWSNILALYGLRPTDFARDQAMFARTQLAFEDSTPDDTIMVPLGSRNELDLHRTNLLSQLAEVWGQVPIRFLQHLDLKNGMYGFIGTTDYTMSPILRPGSIVQIDGNQRKIVQAKWQNEHDRPIYFIELRGEYICSWCEILEGELLSIPYPNAKCEIRSFAHPRDAEVVGLVTGVITRFGSAAE